MTNNPRDTLRAAVARETAGWTKQQKQALYYRMSREATRQLVAAEHPSAGALAQSIDPSTVQTPALELIDQEIEWALHTRDARLAVSMPPQEGKLLADDTPVPTPDGWKRHGDLQPGDKVFHPSGRVQRVVEVHPPAHATLRLHFTDGTHIDCHPHHEWLIHRSGSSTRVREAGWLAEHAIETGTPGKRGHYYLNKLPHREALDLPDRHLPIDPYTLGLWLGDGRTGGAYIHHQACDDYRYAYPVSSTWVHRDTGVVQDYLGGGFHRLLRATGLLGNKHIPAEYLRGSISQRRALLEGLIDSDGHIPSNGNQISFDNTDRALTLQVAELIRSLGYRVGVHKPTAPSAGGTVDGKTIEGRKAMWRVAFSPHDGYVPTRLDRYQGRITARAVRRRVAIKRIEQIPPTLGRCITVESEDGMYLAGEGMLPTHNSTRVGVWGPIRALVDNPERRVVLASYAEDLAKRTTRQARNLVRDYGAGAHDPVTGAPLPDKLGLALADDLSSAVNWSLAGHAGGMFGVGVGGGLTGRPADLLIIDDPLKGMAEADSNATRAHMLQWWESVAYTRLAPGAPIIIIQTRWHEDDLVGHVTRQDGGEQWRVVNIPAVSTPGVPDALGREPGVAMVSARGRTAEDFERIRRQVGERTWAALYLGRPTPAQGGLFSQAWFDRNRVPKPPEQAATRIVSVDPAETGSRDEAGIIAMQCSADGRVYVTGDYSGKMQSDRWARTAVLAAIKTNAGEVLFEAFTTGPTYERVIKDAWLRVRREARLLRDEPTMLDAVHAYQHLDTCPDDPLAALQEVDQLAVPVPDSDAPPFHITPWRAKGDKTARSVGTRQAADTGRLALAGSYPELESQAVSWQQGQSSPDRMDALVNGFERCMQLVGRQSSISSPASVQRRARPRGTGGRSFWSRRI